MKKILLMTLALGIGFASMAQVSKNLRASKNSPLNKTTYVADKQMPNSGPALPFNTTTKGTKAMAKTAFASSGNILSVLFSQEHCLTVNADLDAAMFVARGGGSFGFNSNQVVATWTTDNGSTFNNMQVLNIDDATHSNRYPSGSIFNPAGNTNISNAFVAYEGTSHNAGTWDHDYYGSMRLDSTFGSVLYAPLDSPQYHQFSMFSFSACGDGKVYSLAGGDDQAAAPRLFTGLSVWQGTFNAVNNNFDWAQKRLSLHLLNEASTGDDHFGGNNSNHMAWSEDGAVGYVYTIGIDTTGGTNNFDNSVIPQIFKTTDHGTTWTKMPGFDFRTIPAVNSKITEWWNTTLGNSGTPRVWFRRENEFRESGYDAIVDKNNNLHILSLIQCGYSSDPDSLFYSFANEPQVMFDVFTTSAGSWGGIVVDTLFTAAVDEANGLPGDPDGWDHRAQMSTSPDGSKVFYVWTDSDTSFFDMVMAPDIFIRSSDVDATTPAVTERLSVTRGSAFDGANFWMYVSNKAFEVSPNVFEIPITTTTNGATSTDPVVHYYFSGVQVVGVNEHNENTDSWVTQNYPNPFSNTTTISVNLSKATTLSIDVTNIMGQKIMTINKGNVASGSHNVVIDGSKLTSGVYFYTVRAGENSVTRKMIVE
ncbi:MAG: T9SS type A sorting domain-containing protein [Bacteroidota bacterium]